MQFIDKIITIITVTFSGIVTVIAAIGGLLKDKWKIQFGNNNETPEIEQSTKNESNGINTQKDVINSTHDSKDTQYPIKEGKHYEQHYS